MRKVCVKRSNGRKCIVIRIQRSKKNKKENIETHIHRSSYARKKEERVQTIHQRPARRNKKRYTTLIERPPKLRCLARKRKRERKKAQITDLSDPRGAKKGRDSR